MEVNMAEVKKKYRLKQGQTHWAPNPEFKEGSDPSGSHYEAKDGALVELTDDQFKAFHDKFDPAESAASSVRDADNAELESAKQTAAVTGTSQNPNAKPTTTTNPGAAPVTPTPTKLTQ
jgi:hypothetical protein